MKKFSFKDAKITLARDEMRTIVGSVKFVKDNKGNGISGGTCVSYKPCSTGCGVTTGDGSISCNYCCIA
ncbi:hypothetical protein CLU81_0510 [Flavobacterium sp. 9]|uniref:hypothetical protein n=1 Tax=Flavobacterium sp. 9 TaxID=2035198 RepID=UPI000C1A5D6D|nr:hypothetical protein [Flavobacterium sp. 9]PIF30108.1 hypothetical protein CLU81_0510 [Flavobacterium sp. 9]